MTCSVPVNPPVKIPSLLLISVPPSCFPLQPTLHQAIRVTAPAGYEWDFEQVDFRLQRVDGRGSNVRLLLPIIKQ